MPIGGAYMGGGGNIASLVCVAHSTCQGTRTSLHQKMQQSWRDEGITALWREVQSTSMSKASTFNVSNIQRVQFQASEGHHGKEVPHLVSNPLMIVPPSRTSSKCTLQNPIPALPVNPFHQHSLLHQRL